MTKNFSTNTTSHPTQNCNCERRILFIQVEADCPAYKLHPEDQGVPGGYFVDVPASMDDDTAAACAMGGFHSQIAIEQLWGYSYTIYDIETDFELDPYQIDDWYEFADQAGEVTSTKQTCVHIHH
ncbi:hypothetical protein [Curvibacter gracilis]|uniref:hypothetical protein n=1 Tax=Curvibacter gracilis TaxID=230310 RepID=UPI0004816F0F|nr:hypothetical protein [Curvibacter gracilis]